MVYTIEWFNDAKFALFDSKVSDFDVMWTPFKRDIVGELSKACKAHGIKLCLYYSHIS